MSQFKSKNEMYSLYITNFHIKTNKVSIFMSESIGDARKNEPVDVFNMPLPSIYRK